MSKEEIAEEAPATEAAPVKQRQKRASGNGAAKTKLVKAKAKAGKPAKARAPRTVDPSKLDQFGLRKGSLKSQAAAMYASKKGATLAEVHDKLDSPQFNVLTELEAKGHTLERSQVDVGGPRKVTRYRLIAK